MKTQLILYKALKTVHVYGLTLQIIRKNISENKQVSTKWGSRHVYPSRETGSEPALRVRSNGGRKKKSILVRCKGGGALVGVLPGPHTASTTAYTVHTNT